jgi:hypothetical protein
MEYGANTRLTSLMKSQGLCIQVATRLLRAFPELTRTLRLEENYGATERLSRMAVERLSALAQAMLVFELPSLADNELQWASGVLPRNGVTYEHQVTMVRWFFEELRRFELAPDDLATIYQLELYLLNQVRLAYHNLN